MKNTIILLLAILFYNCCQNKTSKEVLQKRIDSLEQHTNNYPSTIYLTQAILWFQHSPELQALYYQGFNTAKNALMYNLNHKAFPMKKNAVVVDIDETILNNSLYQGWLLVNDLSFSDSTWTAWILDTISEPLPGAIEFLNFAAKAGCEIFYVSNRKHDLHFMPTLQNLKKYNLPFTDEKHLLLESKRDTTLNGRSTKEIRRLKIELEYNLEILLFCGDQLTDFNKAFDFFNTVNETLIKDSVMKYEYYFGNRYIIFPNPMYCDWLNNIIHNTNKNNGTNFNSLRNNEILKWND